MVITKTEWEKMIRKADLKAKEQELHKKHTLRKFVAALKKALTFELLIGLVAAFSLYAYFGWDDLFRVLLSWIIGLTMVSTMITFMVNRYKNLLHLK